jgi:Zn-finger nucleic acid-binding protein
VAVAACDLCGGVWVDTQVFETLVARARHAELGGRNGWPGAAVAPGGGAPPGAVPLTPGAAAALGRGRLYLPCALCGKLMNRINFGRKSGVIVDVCRAHGLWFDLDELPRVLSWVESGGEDRARRLAAEEAQAAERERHLAAGDHPPETWLHGTAEPHGFGDLLDFLDSSLRGLFHPWTRS